LWRRFSTDSQVSDTVCVDNANERHLTAECYVLLLQDVANEIFISILRLQLCLHDDDDVISPFL